MKRPLLLALLLTALAVPGSAQDLATSLGIVPRPRMVTATNTGVFTMTDRCIIYANDDVSLSSTYLVKSIKASTGKVLTVTASKPPAHYIQLRVNENLKSSSLQAYRLLVSGDNITIEGKSPVAVFYGVQTLLQLMPVNVYSSSGDVELKWDIPALAVMDEPYFKELRGLQIDVSRHFLTKDEVFQVIDYIAMHKMNILHMHLTDDQGWRIEIKAFPKLAARTKRSVFFTQAELKEIIAYANSLYITVIPEVDMPGHMKAATKAYPYLKSKNNKKGKVIRIDKEGEVFCKQVLKEVKEVFGDVPIHIGFDEVNLGSQTYTDQEITGFAKCITSYVKDELKVTPIVWDDAFEKGLDDKDVLIQWWRHGKQDWWENLELTMDQKLQLMNQPYILSPACWTYFDMRNTNGSPGAAWAGAISVDKIYNWDPMIDLVDADSTKRHLAKGIIACTWAEQITDFSVWQERVFPRLAALTEKCWSEPADVNKSKPSWDVWRDEVLIKKQLERYKSMGVNFWSKDDPSLLLKVKNGEVSQ